MEDLFDKALLAKKIKLNAEQILLENNINFDTSDEVVKILAVDASAVVDNPMEPLMGECTIGGKLFVNIVYETVGGDINNQTSISAFSHKVLNENICVGANICVNANILNCEIDKLINNQLKIVATVNFDIDVIKNDEVVYLKNCGEGCYIKNEESEITTFVGQYCEKFEEKIDISVRGGVKKVLMTNTECHLKDWDLGPGFVSIECELYSRILYADLNDPSELQTIVTSKIIKQEVEISAANKNFDLDLSAYVLKDGVLLEIQEVDEENTNIELRIPIVVCSNAFECKKIIKVSDIYSVKDALSIQYGEGATSKVCKPEYIEDKIEGNVVLNADQLRIDKYLAHSNPNVVCSNYYVNNGVLTIEGIVNANVIYLNDEVGSPVSVEIEIPYVIEKKVNYSNNVIINPMLTVFDVDIMVKRGREIYFDAKIKAFINICEEAKFKSITKVEAVNSLPEKEGAIEIYFGRAGETVWDIAKTLKIAGDVIVNQNPDIVDPLEKDQNIAIYYQKNRK